MAREVLTRMTKFEVRRCAARPKTLWQVQDAGHSTQRGWAVAHMVSQPREQTQLLR